jgi:ketosteroid isomerase-like protein
MVDGVSSKVRDIHVECGDTGAITCVVDRTYTMDGQGQAITAPTSITCRKEDGDWKIAVFHSVPLADEAIEG